LTYPLVCFTRKNCT